MGATIRAFCILCAWFVFNFAYAQPTQTVELPWNNYTNTKYEGTGKCGSVSGQSGPCGNFYTFENVRFGAPPTRFQKAVLPVSTDLPTQGYNCFETPVQALACPKTNSLAQDLEDPPPFGGFLPYDSSGFDEDCLFADIYVPAEALPISDSPKLPVVVWLYGGAYIFGSKNAGGLPFYNATGLFRTGYDDKQRFIFVAPNYRLGAWGWLAGDDFANDGGTPNLGLWDQRLALDFVDKWIWKFGGDNTKVSLWGESAGAGSILHHLTSTDPPSIRTAVMQSPAYPLQWDSTSDGYAAGIVRNMTECAQSTGNCGDETPFECLQNLDVMDFWHCSNQTIEFEWLQKGLFAFGPAVDHSYIDHLPAVALSNSEMANVSALIVSHVFDEASHFVPCFVDDKSPSTYNDYINNFLGPKYAFLADEINAQYPAAGYKNTRGRAQAVIQDSGFTCNTRYLHDAYYSTDTSLYMLQYDFLANFKIGLLTRDFAVHASDLFPTFYNSNINVTALQGILKRVLRVTLPPSILKLFLDVQYHLAQEYQYFLASFAVNEYPKQPNNKFKTPSWPAMSKDDNPEMLEDMRTRYVLPSWRDRYPTYFEQDVPDTQNNKSTCEFWRGIASKLESAASAATLSVSKSDRQKVNGDVPAAATPLVVQDAGVKADL